MKKIVFAMVLVGLTYAADAQSKKNPGRTRQPSEVDMKGTNPKQNSYAEDTAILNNAAMGRPHEPAETVDMKGTNPKQNSYAEDTAILNDANMRRRR